MKKLAAVILLAVLGFFIFKGLYSFNEGEGEGGFTFKKYGEADLSQRVSDKIISKDVNGQGGEVVYKQTVNAESGAANIVTSIVVDYRSFDTLGEVTVLFISALGVSLLLGSAAGGSKRKQFGLSRNFILKNGARAVFGIVLVTGVYIFVHGHLTPGGGFPGGSMIASAVTLMYFADSEFRLKFARIKAVEGTAGSLYVIAGLLGGVVGGYFLYNLLPNGTVGNLFSAGFIPIIYVLIGLKVGAELSGIITDFLPEGVES